jgi:S-formylglutathione hydrolase FrmB
MHFTQVMCSLLLACALPGCTVHGDPTAPIPTALVPATTAPAKRLVVILPGRADDLDELRRSGAVQAVQSSWPDADVVLAELTMDYYLKGEAPQLLRSQVIVPARRRGYREIWLAGASLGGLGTLMYDQTYPGEMDGLVLLAPYLGERPLLTEIEQAGGVAVWDAGPVQPISPQTWQRELWRHIQVWSLDSTAAHRVWLAYGESDRLEPTMPLLVSALPAEQVLVRDGGHSWSVWSPALADVLRRAGSGGGGGQDLRAP